MREHHPSDDQSADDTAAEHQSHAAEDRSTDQSHAADDRSTDQSHAADDRSNDQSHAADDRLNDQSPVSSDAGSSHGTEDHSTDTGSKWTKDEDSNVSEISKEFKSNGGHSGSHEGKGTSLSSCIQTFILKTSARMTRSCFSLFKTLVAVQISQFLYSAKGQKPLSRADQVNATRP